MGNLIINEYHAITEQELFDFIMDTIGTKYGGIQDLRMAFQLNNEFDLDVSVGELIAQNQTENNELDPVGLVLEYAVSESQSEFEELGIDLEYEARSNYIDSAVYLSDTSIKRLKEALREDESILDNLSHTTTKLLEFADVEIDTLKDEVASEVSNKTHKRR